MKKLIKLPPGVSPAEVVELERLMGEIGPDAVKKMNETGELRETLKGRVKMRASLSQQIYQTTIQAATGMTKLESLAEVAATKAAEAARELKMD
jgi:hypothetical protein